MSASDSDHDYSADFEDEEVKTSRSVANTTGGFEEEPVASIEDSGDEQSGKDEDDYENEYDDDDDLDGGDEAADREFEDSNPAGTDALPHLISRASLETVDEAADESSTTTLTKSQLSLGDKSADSRTRMPKPSVPASSATSATSATYTTMTTTTTTSIASKDRNPAGHTFTTTTNQATKTGPSKTKKLESLRRTNELLKRQLKALEASGATVVTSDDVQRLQNALQAKEKHVAMLKKRLAHSKGLAQDLKSKTGSVFVEKLVALENQRREKELEVAQLIQENKGLANVQRSMTKRIEEFEKMQEEWPRRLECLNGDLRVAKSRHKAARDAANKAQAQLKRHHEQMMKLIDKNRRLQQELQKYKASPGHQSAEAEKSRLLDQFDQERHELMHKIQTLERGRGGQKLQQDAKLRSLTQRMRELQKEVDVKTRILEEKEQEVRMQVLQLSKLKERLRDAGLGKGIPDPASTASASTLASGNAQKQAQTSGADTTHKPVVVLKTSTGEACQSPKSPRSTKSGVSSPRTRKAFPPTTVSSTPATKPGESTVPAARPSSRGRVLKPSSPEIAPTASAASGALAASEDAKGTTEARSPTRASSQSISSLSANLSPPTTVAGKLEAAESKGADSDDEYEDSFESDANTAR